LYDKTLGLFPGAARPPGIWTLASRQSHILSIASVQEYVLVTKWSWPRAELLDVQSDIRMKELTGKLES